MATISHADKLALLLAAGDAKRSHKYTSLTSNERKRYTEYLSKLTLVQNFFLIAYNFTTQDLWTF